MQNTFAEVLYTVITFESIVNYFLNRLKEKNEQLKKQVLKNYGFQFTIFTTKLKYIMTN